jgi:hypothetical protein
LTGAAFAGAAELIANAAARAAGAAMASRVEIGARRMAGLGLLFGVGAARAAGERGRGFDVGGSIGTLTPI